MTASDEPTSRLSKALDDFIAGTKGVDDTTAADDAEPYQMPEIVPATLDVPSDQPDETPPATDQSPPANGDEVTAGAPIVPTLPPANPAHVTPPIVRPVVPPGVAMAQPAVVMAVTPAVAATPAATLATTHVTGWADHMTASGPAPTGPALRTAGGRPRVRKVTRVLRHIDPWSTFKVALIFSAVTYLVALTSGVLLWRVADSTGTLDNVERWFTQFGWETFELKGGEIFANAWVIGLFAAVALTGAAVLIATLFNLVSDIVGGIRMTVLEEEVVERTISSTRRYVVRRPPIADDTGGMAASWTLDDDDPIEPAGSPTTSPTAASNVAESDQPSATAWPQSAAVGSNWYVDDDDPV